MSIAPRRWRDDDSAREGMAALLRSADDDSPTTQQLAELAARLESRAKATAVPPVALFPRRRPLWLMVPILAAAAAIALFVGLRNFDRPHDEPSGKPTKLAAAAQVDAPRVTHGSVVITTSSPDWLIFVDGNPAGVGTTAMAKPVGTVLDISCRGQLRGTGQAVATVTRDAQTIECSADIMSRDSTAIINTAGKASLHLGNTELGIAHVRLTRPYGTVETIRCFMGSSFGQVTVEWRGEFQTVECVLDGHRQKPRDHKKTGTAYPDPTPAPRTGAP